MGANANGWLGAPIKAPDEAKTGRLREEGHAEWRPKPPGPFGVLPKTPGAALRSLAGCPTRLRLRALRGALSAAQRVRAHSLNRPSNNASVVDTRTHTVVATLPTGTTPAGIAVNPSGTRVYVAIAGTAREPGTTILVIDAATSAALGSIPAAVGPSAITVNPADTRIYATVGMLPGSVAVIDGATNVVVGGIPVKGGPFAIALTRVGPVPAGCAM